MTVITEAKLRSMLKKGIPNPYPVREGDKITPAAMDFLKGRGIQLKSYQSVELIPESMEENWTIPVGVSNRHVHLSPEDVERLFGPNYQLTPLRELSQPGQFAAHEKVTLLGPKGVMQGVRILGPARGATQVEISRSDCYQLGVQAPVRLSGSIEGTPGITLIGPKGFVVLDQGVIIAKCHVHMSPDDSQRFQVRHGDTVILQTMGDRPLIYPDVVVRVSPNYVLDFHIDLDEANAANLKTGDRIRLIGRNGEFLSWARK
jgi:putative phosphotransacetylase